MRPSPAAVHACARGSQSLQSTAPLRCQEARLLQHPKLHTVCAATGRQASSLGASCWLMPGPCVGGAGFGTVAKAAEAPTTHPWAPCQPSATAPPTHPRQDRSRQASFAPLSPPAALLERGCDLARRAGEPFWSAAGRRLPSLRCCLDLEWRLGGCAVSGQARRDGRPQQGREDWHLGHGDAWDALRPRSHVSACTSIVCLP